ncbi:MAG: ParB/RepB/Spo0J family partition protein [Sedimenticola sp.]
MTEAHIVAQKKKLGSISERMHSVNNPGDKIRLVKIDKLSRGEFQPRREFNEDALNDLAETIRKHGVMQPIIIRSTEDDRFEIIAGERRWRAAKIAGLTEIPAITKSTDDKTTLALSLIENLQREDLSYIEEAESFQRLKDEFDLKNKEVAETVGKSEKEISELLGLLKLPDSLKVLLYRGTVSPQILGVLKRCYKLNSEATKKFISNKDSVTYSQANAFQKSLKGNKKEQPENETKNKEKQKEVSKETENEQKKTNESVIEESEENQYLHSDNENESTGFLDTIIITILKGEDKWILDLTKAEEDKNYCWLTMGTKSERVEAKSLSVLSVERLVGD